MKKIPISFICMAILAFSGCVKNVAKEAQSNRATTQNEPQVATSESVPINQDLPQTSVSTSPESTVSAPTFSPPNSVNDAITPPLENDASSPTSESNPAQSLAEFIPWEKTEMAAFFAENTKSSEFITLTPALNQSVTIEAKEGTIFTLPPNAFVDEEGKTIVKPLTLEIKECYKMKDILLSNLSTKSGDMPLETDGMVYIQAKSEGKAVKLGVDKTIIIEMPTKEKKDRMELFYGKQSKVTGTMDWKVADTRIPVRIADASRNTNLSPSTIGGMKDFSLGTKQFDLGKVETEFGVKTDNKDRRMPFAKVTAMSPKLNSYKAEISGKLNAFVCERNIQSYRNFRTTHPEYKYFPIAPPLCVAVADLDAAFLDVEKYKNYAFKRSMPFIAIMCKDLYFKQINLMGAVRFDANLWKKDVKFFSDNFKLIKETGFDVMAAVDAWREQADQLLSEHQAKYAASYLFATNQLGWINCDRFIPNDEQGRNIFVKCGKDKSLDLKLIFEDTKMVLPAFFMGSQLAFTNVPIGKKAKIFGVRKQGKRIEFAIKELITGQEVVITDLKFEEMSFAQLEKEFQGR